MDTHSVTGTSRVATGQKFCYQQMIGYRFFARLYILVSIRDILSNDVI